GSADETVKVWDVPTGREVLTLRGSSNSAFEWGVTGLAFSPDGSRLASTSWREVKVWDVMASQEARALPVQGRNVSCLAFSADGKRLFAADESSGVTAWDADTGRPAQAIRVPIPGKVLSPDGRLSAAGFKVWETATGRQVFAPPPLPGDIHLKCVAFSPDGRRLAGVDSFPQQ